MSQELLWSRASSPKPSWAKASLDAHPNIVNIVDIDQRDGLYYMIMKYVEGEDLLRRTWAARASCPGSRPPTSPNRLQTRSPLRTIVA
ncbi:MAG: hypothetical protein R2748_29645 [Bryobacterales bacterium]